MYSSKLLIPNSFIVYDREITAKKNVVLSVCLLYIFNIYLFYKKKSRLCHYIHWVMNIR